jgi:hypothetical protein
MIHVRKLKFQKNSLHIVIFAQYAGYSKATMRNISGLKQEITLRHWQLSGWFAG